MEGLAPRFPAPGSAARPRGARLLEGHSPKLRRRVQFFSHDAFALWIDLEADPTVTAFCERPALAGADSDAPPIDFWLRRPSGEEFVALVRGDDQPDPPARLEGLAVRRLTDADMAARRMWIANWQRMLPVVNATRGLIPAALTKAVRAGVDKPLPLGDIERAFSRGDPALVRGAIFDLLRTGGLAAPTLRTEPLSLGSVVEPVR